AMQTIELSQAPVNYSHTRAAAVNPRLIRLRKDEEMVACAKKGGLINLSAVPNSMSDDPKQNINCTLDQIDYVVKLVGADHVGLGTDALVGDHVGFHRIVMGREGHLPAAYLDGIESPADGKNLIRGLIARGHSAADIKKIAGGNALAYFRRVLS
ncbi:MAG: membrane dipeptidase, partial [Chloroflexi bacterium]|nr:membrane dipeptidase [Chloroflexota bacterium]